MEDKQIKKKFKNLDKRVTMLEGLVMDAKSDRKWMMLIGAAMVSATAALGYLTYDVNSKVNYIAGEHRILSQERHQ